MILSRRSVIVALLAGLIGGCARRSPNLPPFDWGGDPDAEIVRLPLTINEPRQDVAIRCRQAFYSKVDLTDTGSHKLPIGMVAYLVPPGAGRAILAGEFIPATQRGTTYSFRAKVRMPETPGAYRLRVETTYSRRRASTTGDPEATTFERPTFSDDGTLFQVTR